ncbi:MAG TPA: ADOP family duplicated permease [Acidobacteriota bacterium]|jgi:putative ABC transport system permease protein
MDWKSRIRAALTTTAQLPDDDVVQELAQHAQAMYHAARADGLSHDEAESRVTDQLERWRLDASALRHKSRRAENVEPPPAVSWSPFAGVAQDIRYAARLLRRQVRFALLAILTMAFGIGLTTVLFSVTYGVLVKPLPWPHADRIVVVKETRGGKSPRFGSFSSTAYLAWRERPATVENIAAWSQRVVTLADAGEPERIRITVAAASLFPVLGARPLIGSFFQEKDEGTPVVVLSESLWRQRFGADHAVLGRLVQLDGQAYTIIGVLADAMAYPDRQARAWVPMKIRPATGNLLSMFSAIALLRPGASAAQAASEGTARGRFAADTGLTTMAIFGGYGPIEVSALPLRDALAAEVRRPLIVLLVAVTLLLVTATANVASLQLARATTRRREMAIRAALGAGTARVTRQLLVESLLLGLTGGGAGLGLAWLLHRLMPSLLPADFPRAGEIGIDTTVIVFALIVSVMTSIVFGMLPALRARRLNLVESLAEDGAAPIGAGTRSRTAQARILIMAGQVAIAFVLLVGASLLGRSFVALLKTDRGYDPSGVMTARLSLPDSLYSPERRYVLIRQILDRLAAMPAVTDAAFTSELPLTPGGSTAAFSIRSRANGGPVPVQASPRVVSARYFSAMRIRIAAGRSFSDSDTESSPPVAIVNRTFARRYLGDAALDAKLPMGIGYQTEDIEASIVGVSDDIRYPTAAASLQPEMYFLYRQLKGRLTVPVVTFVVRTAGGAGALGPALRTAVREADDHLVPEAIMTLEDRMLTSLSRPRLYSILLGGFAAFALVVAGVGLFGVLSYSVALRSRELAVRSALGARQVDIARLILRQGLAATGAGLAAGLLGSFVLMRSIAALLYGVTPQDPITYCVVASILLVVAAAASFAPARRAARVDPMRELRS